MAKGEVAREIQGKAEKNKAKGGGEQMLFREDAAGADPCRRHIPLPDEEIF